MPNHVTSHIRVGLTGITAEEFLAKIKGEKDVIDFETILPPPENMFRDNLSSEDRRRCAEEGIPNWYDWQVANWGTKWNAYDQEVVSQWDGDECGEVEIRFDTAWAPPIPVIEALREWPEVEWIGGNWIEEFCEDAGVY